MANAKMEEQIGRVLGDRYRLVAPIGSGASSQVFLADDARLKRRVAVKLLHESLAQDDTFLRRFETEARLVAGLSHPNILAVHDWGQDGVPYLVTEYLSGGSLRGILDSGKTLSQSQALVVGLEAARALDYAHGRGLVHRDIKPDNLLFDDEGKLRIADFGLARALAETSVTEPTGTFLGSARYASPEQAKGANLDGRSDIYSLALVLSEAVTGEVAFEADTQLGVLMARTEANFDPGEDAGPLRGPLSRAGSLEPSLRPDADSFAVSMMATAEALPRPEPIPVVGAILDEPTTAEPTVVGEPEPTTARPEAAPAEAPPRSRKELKAIERRKKQQARAERLEAIERGEIKRRRWPWAIVGVLLLAGIGVGAYFLYENSQTEPVFTPDVVGASFDELDELVGEAEYSIKRLDTRQEGTVPEQIVAQEPAAGVEIESDGTLEVTVSLGEPLAVVPGELVGLDLVNVQGRLESANLMLGEVTEVFDETVPVGTVIAIEDVLPELERGTAIAVTVSKGPAPRPVPEGLVGLTLEEATALLAESRLTPTTTEEFSNDIEVGRVISIAPAAGTEVEADSAVALVISLGREPVVIPDVEGLDIAEAQQILEDAGLIVAEIEGPPANPVLTTDPPNGTDAFVGDEVVIFTEGAGDNDEDDEGDG